mgnify:CR=1 FL=1
MSREIDYGNLMHSAMRGLIRTVLQEVADHGLPGNIIFSSPSTPTIQMHSWRIGCAIAILVR